MATLAAAALGTVLIAAPAQAVDHSNIEIDLADGMCLDVPASNFSSGVQVQEWTCNHTGAQKWNLVYVSSHYFQVQAAAKSSLCLNNWTSSAPRGGEIRLYPCSSTDSWFNQVDPDWNGYYRFQPKNASANCVTAWGGTGQGNKMKLDTCSNRGLNSYFDIYDQVHSEQ